MSTLYELQKLNKPELIEKCADLISNMRFYRARMERIYSISAPGTGKVGKIE